ncbi:hypothetical protein V8D89_003357 [Ganoderma adspersum]
MPPQRRAHVRTSTIPRNQSSRLVRLRARLRKLMDQKLKDLTGNRRARMRWSAKGYARYIVVRGEKRLEGWPTYAGVPFGNLSDVPGGQPVMELLLRLWASGVLRFEDASEETIELAAADPSAVLPGTPIQGGGNKRTTGDIMGREDTEDPIEDAVWSSEIGGDE